MTVSERANVLYITYTGLLEPLGQSQVLAYLTRLQEHHNITVLSFEKPLDSSEESRKAKLEDELSESSIRWISLRYHKRVPPVATAWDVLRGVLRGSRLIREHQIDIIHARSYVSAAIALQLNQLFSTRFIFDMRGFWVDERVDGGLWRQDGILFRLGKALEKRALSSADVIVSLTEAAVEEMGRFPYLPEDTTFEVIPTCVDTELFSLPLDTKSQGDHDLGEGPLRLAWIGSVGTWYLFEPAVEAFRQLARQAPGSQFLILNHGDQGHIYRTLVSKGFEPSSFEIKAVPHDKVPAEMTEVDAGIFFIKPAYSKKASAPTKMAEFLAMGIPCFTNSGVGDVEEILSSKDAGVVIDGMDDGSIEAGVEDLLKLLDDPATSKRCRELALERFDVRAGAAAYDRIYRELAAQGRFS